jgi:Recombinase
VPEEAETVRLIFKRYLEVGSIRDLAEDLDCRTIRTRQQTLSTDEIRGGIRFDVGSLAQLLRNRFFIGEIVYRGAVHISEHEPILDRSLFDAVQAKLAAGATARQLKLKGSPSILAGLIFDEDGNRMTPTRTNKRGARYPRRPYILRFSTRERRQAGARRRTLGGSAQVPGRPRLTGRSSDPWSQRDIGVRENAAATHALDRPGATTNVVSATGAPRKAERLDGCPATVIAQMPPSAEDLSAVVQQDVTATISGIRHLIVVTIFH